MQLMPIVYVTDMPRAVSFYEALGLTLTTEQRDGYWLELTLGDAILALHKSETLPDVGTNRRVDLTLVTHQPLEALVEQLNRAGVRPTRSITDEAFGRSLLLHDPDGLPVQVNEHNTELYT
jgi:predicted lactoylglutathione lyase